ncbi:hypothetical protein MTR67_018039 [Solanum verrucosum]|uniref:Uncharacterized protein n=1 Tax=Solanum verrucosum TaxID=315347 RepID=A0AAF0TMC4_SOLVR|nr:hypothetical protein MTR67_018039 [Solanum verrucosum]
MFMNEHEHAEMVDAAEDAEHHEVAKERLKRKEFENFIGKSARKVAQRNLQEMGTSNGFETLEYYGQVGRNEAGQEDELNRLVEGITYNHPT